MAVAAGIAAIDSPGHIAVVGDAVADTAVKQRRSRSSVDSIVVELVRRSQPTVAVEVEAVASRFAHLELPQIVMGSAAASTIEKLEGCCCCAGLDMNWQVLFAVCHPVHHVLLGYLCLGPLDHDRLFDDLHGLYLCQSRPE